jgi:hypothetical protein
MTLDDFTAKLTRGERLTSEELIQLLQLLTPLPRLPGTLTS